MRQKQKNLWIDTRLSAEEMDFLHHQTTVTNEPKPISKIIEDKDDWFYENVLKKYTERLFYDDWNNYRKYHIVKEKEEPQFEMNRFWVNYQRQYEFNPLHFHSGLYSFVIFMKIPTHWKEQHEMNKDEFRARVASDFVFVWGSENKKYGVVKESFQLSSEDEGRMLFFPAFLQHMVYPFYECEEERVTISGNIRLYDSKKGETFHVDPPHELKRQESSVGEYEVKKKMLETIENSVEMLKKELKQIKKVEENRGSN